MSHDTNSPERIAADLLIAAMQNSPSVDQKEWLCDPEKIPENYQALFEAVFNARPKAVEGH